MNMVFLLIMICLDNDEGINECERNIIDQFETVESCMDTLEVIKWELSPHIKPDVGVSLWCDIDRGVIMMERGKTIEDK